jgi:hypothetical protein
MATEPDARTDRFPREHHLLGRREHVPEVPPVAPERFWIPDPEHPDLPSTPVELPRKLTSLFPSMGMRSDLARRPLPNLRPKRGVLVGLEEIGHDEPG